jgi:hypothetical protein
MIKLRFQAHIINTTYIKTCHFIYFIAAWTSIIQVTIFLSLRLTEQDCIAVILYTCILPVTGLFLGRLIGYPD